MAVALASASFFLFRVVWYYECIPQQGQLQVPPAAPAPYKLSGPHSGGAGFSLCVSIIFLFLFSWGTCLVLSNTRRGWANAPRWGEGREAAPLARCSPPTTLTTLGPACCAGHHPSCPFTLSGAFTIGQQRSAQRAPPPKRQLLHKQGPRRARLRGAPLPCSQNAFFPLFLEIWCYFLQRLSGTRGEGGANTPSG
jgi:hypothetical protein